MNSCEYFPHKNQGQTDSHNSSDNTKNYAHNIDNYWAFLKNTKKYEYRKKDVKQFQFSVLKYVQGGKAKLSGS